MEHNPCLECGACCAFFRASFYWAESDAVNRGKVPSELTVKITDFYVAMKGTERFPPRCIALTGEIGIKVYCNIYEQRSSSCRDFEPSWWQYQANLKCDQARLAWGLKPLSPDSWFHSRDFPRAA